MNVDGLLKVLSKWMGSDVVLGVKRGARAVHDRVPVPGPETQWKATLVLQSSTTPGVPDQRESYNDKTNQIETLVTCHNETRCGLRLESFKGADEDPVSTLAKFRLKMFVRQFREELREQGFGLMDVGQITKINSQAAVVGFLEFRISHAEVYSDSPDVSWIETAQIKPVIDEVEEDTYTVP